MTSFFKNKIGSFGFLWNYIAIAIAILLVSVIAGKDILKLYDPRKIILHDDQALISVHSVGSAMIAASSIVISFIVYYFIVRGREFSNRYIYFLFSLFLLFLCLFVICDILAIWVNYSWVYATIKVITGVVGNIIVFNLPSIVDLMKRLNNFDEAQETERMREQLHDTKNKLHTAYLKIEALSNEINERRGNDKSG